MLKKILTPILAVLVIFEEWLWDILTVAGVWLSRGLRLERFDERLSRATPNQALLAFSIPLLIVAPINLAGLLLLAHGGIVSGILLEIAAKLLGTLLVARVFRLVRPALLTFQWFAKVYETVTRLLRWAHERIRDTALYRLSLALKREGKLRIRRIVKAFGLSG